MFFDAFSRSNRSKVVPEDERRDLYVVSHSRHSVQFPVHSKHVLISFHRDIIRHITFKKIKIRERMKYAMQTNPKQGIGIHVM